MPVIRRFDADGLTDGTVVVADTVAGTNDQPFTEVVGGAVTIDNSGERPPRLEFAQQAGATCYVHWENLGDLGVCGGRFKVELSALPSSSTQLLTARHDPGGLWRIDLSGPGRLRFRYSTTSYVEGTRVLAVDTPYRVEWSVTTTQADVYLYEGDSATAVDHITYVGAISMTGRVQFGPSTLNPTVPTLWMDDLLVNDDGSLPGPWASESAPTVHARWPGIPDDTSISCGFIVSNASSVRLAVDTDETMASPTFSASTAPSLAGWVRGEVAGLQPDTTYYLAAELDGVLSAEMRAEVRTAPPAGTQGSFKFLFGSCQQTGANHVVFDTMGAESAEFLVHLGDLHYADTLDEATWRAAVRSSLAANRFAQLLATTPMSYNWDNHDWGGEFTHATSGPAAYAPAAIRELLSPSAFADPSPTGGVYRTWTHRRVRFIQFDPRRFRDPYDAPDDENKTMLGATQKQWFFDTLSAATEPVIVICSNTIWRLAGSNDRWQTYPNEWGEISDWVTARPEIMSRLYVVSGDLHMVAADNGSAPLTMGVPNVVGAAFSQTPTASALPWSGGAHPNEPDRGQYGVVTVTDNGTTITLSFEGKQDDGTTLVSMETLFAGGDDPTMGPHRIWHDGRWHRVIDPTAYARMSDVESRLSALEQ